MNRSPNNEPERLPLQKAEVANRLDELAELLELQGANPFRCGAYRTAAQTVRKLSTPAFERLAHEGPTGLMQLPGIGQSLARSIEKLAQTGHLRLLERLRGDAQPERIFATVAGIGPKTAAMIHEELEIETLPELEAAAYDGRLASLPGMGAKKVRSVRESLAGRFRRRVQTPKSRPRRPPDWPPVAELLSIDQEYRSKAQGDRLPRIAPRRFNPTGQAWLPILHTHRQERHYTALYSNTARAHEMGTTHDWVIIYRDDAHGDGQWTVVTSRFGKLKGHRVVRGREVECIDFYGAQQAGDSTQNFR